MLSVVGNIFTEVFKHWWDRAIIQGKNYSKSMKIKSLQSEISRLHNQKKRIDAYHDNINLFYLEIVHKGGLVLLVVLVNVILLLLFVIMETLLETSSPVMLLYIIGSLFIAVMFALRVTDITVRDAAMLRDYERLSLKTENNLKELQDQFKQIESEGK